MKAWRVHRYGKPREVLQLDEIPVPEPAPRELRVRVDAITLNFNDLDGIYGRYKTVNPGLPYTPGMEVLGHVEACGQGAEAWLGKRVCAVPAGAFGGFAEAALCPVAMAFEMPEGIPDVEAAAIYFPFHLSWLALFERGKLGKGETVLVHAAAGGVGSAAVQLAKQAGARVIATAGSEKKVDFCKELGADVAVNYRATSFADVALEVTEGRGVDVAFDSVGGEVTLETMRCMAFNGRLLVVGFASGIEAEDESVITPRPIILGNYSLCGVCHAYTDDPVAFKRQTGLNFPSHEDGVVLHGKVLALLEEKKIRPIVGQKAAFSELPAAFDAVEERQTIGRTVVLLDRSGEGL